MSRAPASSTATPILDFQQVAFAYPGFAPTLGAIDLALQRGEWVSILGASGCGKSTLLRLAANLLAPTAGRICRDCTPDALAFIFQDATLLPWASVRDNIALPLRLRNVEPHTAAARIDALLDLLHLRDAARHFPAQLSGGMQMRTSIARALSLQPDLLLLDEPFAALDAITRNRLNAEMLRLRERDAWSALFVTHSVTEAVFLSHRVFIMLGQPARLMPAIPIDLPFPRNNATRESLDFQRTVAEVHARLEHAVAQAHPQS